MGGNGAGRSRTLARKSTLMVTEVSARPALLSKISTGIFCASMNIPKRLCSMLSPMVPASMPRLGLHDARVTCQVTRRSGQCSRVWKGLWWVQLKRARTWL